MLNNFSKQLLECILRESKHLIISVEMIMAISNMKRGRSERQLFIKAICYRNVRSLNLTALIRHFNLVLMKSRACIRHVLNILSPQVFLECGNSNTLADVTEPTLCKYRMTFFTPLACPSDALLGMCITFFPKQEF